jgi:hypothetical protein
MSVLATIPLFERLLIESQSNCNRSCWFCPRTYDRSGKYLDSEGRPIVRRMATAKILDLLDQARVLGFHGQVAFYHYSEPLLDERNVLLADEARRRGMIPYLHTNGDLLERSPALRAEVQRSYDLVVIGLYDYRTPQELEATKRAWRELLPECRDLRFNPIGPLAASEVDAAGVPRALVPSDPRMALPTSPTPTARAAGPRFA